MLSTKHWVIDFQNDWTILPNFTLIEIRFERFMGYELYFVILGLGVFIRYNPQEALDKFDEWQREAEKEKPLTKLTKMSQDAGLYDDKELVDHYAETWTALKDK